MSELFNFQVKPDTPDTRSSSVRLSMPMSPHEKVNKAMMGAFTGTAVVYFEKISDIWREQSEWSQKVFGPDTVRGPIGPLKHLEREVPEAIQAFQLLSDPMIMGHDDSVAEHYRLEYLTELADMGLLWFDIIRRSGYKPIDVFNQMYIKLQINKSRAWPEFDSNKVNEAVEHKRGEQ